MRYLLNSAVITAPGTYTYRTITADEARQWGQAAPWTSTIGYASTADLLAAILGVPVPVDRTPCTFQPGDEALVCRLAPGTRLEAAMKRGDEGRAQAQDLMDAGQFELGVLTRTA